LSYTLYNNPQGEPKDLNYIYIKKASVTHDITVSLSHPDSRGLQYLPTLFFKWTAASHLADLSACLFPTISCRQ
jgi:hypothetical protein